MMKFEKTKNDSDVEDTKFKTITNNKCIDDGYIIFLFDMEMENKN